MKEEASMLICLKQEDAEGPFRQKRQQIDLSTPPVLVKTPVGFVSRRSAEGAIGHRPATR